MLEIDTNDYKIGDELHFDVNGRLLEHLTLEVVFLGVAFIELYEGGSTYYYDCNSGVLICDDSTLTYNVYYISKVDN